MKKSQLKVLNELKNDPEFKGKKLLDSIIWLNTTQPKYKIGDCVKVTNYKHRVYGHQVINFNAKIVEINAHHFYKNYGYELEMIIQIDGKETIVTEYIDEENIKQKVKNNINILSSKKDNTTESLDITF